MVEFYTNDNHLASFRRKILCSWVWSPSQSTRRKWEARVTANTGVFDRPRVLEPRASTTLVCCVFKFLQVKNHVSLSAFLSTLGQFQISSSDAAYSHPCLNSETLTRRDFSVFQKLVWKISPGTAWKRMPGCLPLAVHKKIHQLPIAVSFLLRLWQAAT